MRFNKCRSYTDAYGIHRFITYQRFLLFRELPLSSHSSLPSFCSSLSSRSVGRSFCFASSPSTSFSSSGESCEMRRIKNHGLISQTRLFPEKRTNQRRGRLDLNRAPFKHEQVEPHDAHKWRGECEAHIKINARLKKKKNRYKTRLSDKRDRRVLSCESYVARKTHEGLSFDVTAIGPSRLPRWRINHAGWSFDIFTTGDGL